MLLVYVNGSFVAPSRITVSANDLAFHYTLDLDDAVCVVDLEAHTVSEPAAHMYTHKCAGCDEHVPGTTRRCAECAGEQNARAKKRHADALAKAQNKP